MRMSLGYGSGSGREVIGVDVLVTLRPCPDWYGRSRLSCLFITAGFSFMSLSPVVHYWTAMEHKTEKKNPILPTSSYVTLKHNITSPDVRCPSVNTHNFKTKTNGPSIDTVWEVGVSASVIRIAQKSYSVKFVKRFHLNRSSFHKVQPEKKTQNKKKNTHKHINTSRVVFTDV